MFLRSQTLDSFNIHSFTCLWSANGLRAYLRAGGRRGAALGEGAAQPLTDGWGGQATVGAAGSRPPLAPGRSQAARGFAKLPGRGAAGGGRQRPEGAVLHSGTGGAVYRGAPPTGPAPAAACPLPPAGVEKGLCPGCSPSARGHRCAPLEIIYSYEADVSDFSVLNFFTLPLCTCRA